jgi:adenine phosphoribosyltransferase
MFEKKEIMQLEAEIKQHIRDIPDFPKPGILFKDITPILQKADLIRKITDEMSNQVLKLNPDAIVGIESRGFLFGMLMAENLKIPFVPVRKSGKLPFHTVKYKYELEYGFSEVEIHTDAIKPGWNVVIHDDLLATGGTSMAAAELAKMQQANICSFIFLIELEQLKGIERLLPYGAKIQSLVKY